MQIEIATFIVIIRVTSLLHGEIPHFHLKMCRICNYNVNQPYSLHSIFENVDIIKRGIAVVGKICKNQHVCILMLLTRKSAYSFGFVFHTESNEHMYTPSGNMCSFSIEPCPGPRRTTVVVLPLCQHI